MVTASPTSPSPDDSQWLTSPDGKRSFLNTSGGRQRLEKYAATQGSPSEGETKQAVTPLPATARQLFSPAVAPTQIITKNITSNGLTPIQRRARERGTGETAPTEAAAAAAAAAMAAAAANEALTLFEALTDRAASKAEQQTTSQQKINHNVNVNTQPVHNTNVNNTHQPPTNVNTKHQQPIQTEHKSSPPSTQNSPGLATEEPAHETRAPHDLTFLSSGLTDTANNMRTINERAFSLYRIEEDLKSKELGIAGLNDLYTDSITRYADLATKVTEGSEGNLLRIQMGDFYFAIKGRKGCSDPTAAALSLMHMSNIRKGLDLTVRQAFMAGTDISDDDLISLCSRAVLTGSYGEYRCSTQAVNSMDPERMVGIFRLSLMMASRDSDTAASFSAAYEEYISLDLSGCLNFVEAMSAEEWRYNIAEALFGGAFITTFFRYSVTSSALHAAVRKELRKSVDQNTKYNKITATWEAAKQKMSEAFDMAKRKGGLVIEGDECGHSNPGDTREPSAHHMSTFQDIKIKCERNESPDCTQEFTHSVADQERYKELKLTSVPKGCGPCRKFRALQAAQSGRKRPCPEWNRFGTCKFGDQCMYTHFKNSDKPAAHVSQPAITFPQLTDGKDKEEIEVDSDDPDYVEW